MTARRHSRKIYELDIQIKKETFQKHTPRYIKEIKLEKKPEFKVGDVIKLTDIFKEGDVVSVTANSKGKGFAGDRIRSL